MDRKFEVEVETYTHLLEGRRIADAFVEAYKIDIKCVDLMFRIISPMQHMDLQLFLQSEKVKLNEYISIKTEQVDRYIRNKRGVQWICKECGDKYGNREVGVATWHEDICDICGKKTGVTEPRDFGGLKIERGMK